MVKFFIAGIGHLSNSYLFNYRMTNGDQRALKNRIYIIIEFEEIIFPIEIIY